MDSVITVDGQPAILTDAAFKEKITAIIPQLRAFARGLCGNPDLADDLVQDTMLKAWDARTRFWANTNFRAWTFTILRNHYFSITRRRKFVGDWDELVADRKLAGPAEQYGHVELGDLMRALAQLPDPQREALILVAAGGLSYEEAAQIMGSVIGTVKSRVARARMALETLMEGGILDSTRASFAQEPSAVVSIFAYLQRLENRPTSSAVPSPADILPAAA